MFREHDAEIGIQYNPAVISWLDRLPSLIGAGENKGQVILYFKGGDGITAFNPATGAQDNLIASFNLWASGVVSLPAITFPLS